MRHISFSDCNMLRRHNEIHFFSSGSVALQELEWHLFSFIILFGGVVVLIENTHVRVDLIFNSSIYTERHERW